MRFSVLVNGNLSSFFNSYCGLKHGDPLSLYLFVIFMELLIKMLFVTINGGFLLGFIVRSRHSSVVNISHLLFVDNTLVFCGANLGHLCYLHALFLCFKIASSLKINVAKLELVPVSNVGNVDGLTGILGWEVHSLPLKYLGLPLRASYKAKFICDSIIKKIECRLPSWKKNKPPGETQTIETTTNHPQKKP
jgi:hypothetical protein